MVFTYALSGTCIPEKKRCDLAGHGKGPRGREWTGQGNISRVGDKTILKATLKGPIGRTVTIDREVSGDAFPDPGF